MREVVGRSQTGQIARWLGRGCVWLAVAGCAGRPASQPIAPPPVSVSLPVERQVTDSKDFIGRTEAVNSVDVRARVSGYLTKIDFAEGSEVTKDSVLFDIDVRPYQAILDQALGQLQQSEANVQLAQANYDRAKRLSTAPVKAITKEALDTAAAQLAISKAQVVAGKAAVASARLNVEFCRVRSAIDGRISRYLVTVGNLVTADQTLLTTIVSQDPMYAYFDVDERTVLDVQALIREGKMRSARTSTDVPVLMELENETGFPHHGTINFINNRISPSTGTLQIRGVFPNPKINGSRVLSPGLFVKIRVYIGNPYKALLITEDAITSDQGQNSVFIVNSQNKVESRRVELGQQHGGLRVVKNGLSPQDKVIVRGLQRVRSDMEVQPKLIAVPAHPSKPSEPAISPTAASRSVHRDGG